MKNQTAKTAVINSKGGVGKTISSVHLGAALAATDKRVLAIDSDLQHGLTSYFDVEVEGPTMADVLTKGASLESAIIPVRENLFLVPATADMETAEMALTGAPGAEIRFKRAMKTLLESGPKFDVILVDCASGWGNVTRNVLLGVDSILVPVNCDEQGSRGAATTIEAARELAAYHDHDLRLLGVLLTVWRETNAARVVADLCMEQWGEAVFETRIRRAEKINELTIRRQTLSETARTPVGDDYAQLAREYLERIKTKVKTRRKVGAK